MRSCLIREHPCLCLLTTASFSSSSSLTQPSFIFLYQQRPPPPSSRNCGSLYTRSVAVLNVLSLLMPRSVCPRGRTTNISAHRLLFRGPILSYTPRVFIVQNPSVKDCGRDVGERERNMKKSTEQKSACNPYIWVTHRRGNIKKRRRNTREKMKHLYRLRFLKSSIFCISRFIGNYVSLETMFHFQST